MGNINRHLKQDEKLNYQFVGRAKDIKEIFKLHESHVVVQICGMQAIGKSRTQTQVLRELLRLEKKCIFKDFTLESIKSEDDVIELLTELQKELSESNKKGVEELRKLDVSEAIKAILRQISKLDEDIVLFLDNVDEVNCDIFKESLMEFLKAVCKNIHLKVIFTSSETFRITEIGYKGYKMTLMELDDIGQLFKTVIKAKGGYVDDDAVDNGAAVANDDDDEDDEDNDKEDDDDNSDNDQFNLVENVLSPENEKFIDVLVRLCSGLPKIAMMIGCELTADDGLLEPKDMIVLIIEDNLHTLSPDGYPQSDKADCYKEALKKVKHRRELIDELNRQMGVDNTASLDCVVNAVPKAKSVAEAKRTARPLLDNNVMDYNKKTQFQMHSILRECCLATKTLDAEDKLIQELLKVGRLHLAKLPDEFATSPWKLEQYLDSLNEPFMNELGPNSEESDLNATKTIENYSLPYNPENLQFQEDHEEATSTCSCHIQSNNTEHTGIASFTMENNKDRQSKNNLDRLSENTNKFTEDKLTLDNLSSISGPSAISYVNLSLPSSEDTIESLEDNVTCIAIAEEENGKSRPKPTNSGEHKKPSNNGVLDNDTEGASGQTANACQPNGIKGTGWKLKEDNVQSGFESHTEKFREKLNHHLEKVSQAMESTMTNGINIGVEDTTALNGYPGKSEAQNAHGTLIGAFDDEKDEGVMKHQPGSHFIVEGNEQEKLRYLNGIAEGGKAEGAMKYQKGSHLNVGNGPTKLRSLNDSD